MSHNHDVILDMDSSGCWSDQLSDKLEEEDGRMFEQVGTFLEMKTSAEASEIHIETTFV